MNRILLTLAGVVFGLLNLVHAEPVTLVAGALGGVAVPSALALLLLRERLAIQTEAAFTLSVLLVVCYWVSASFLLLLMGVKFGNGGSVAMTLVLDIALGLAVAKSALPRPVSEENAHT